MGYIILGIVIGHSGLKLLTLDSMKGLEIFSKIAITVIMFVLGSQFRGELIRKSGKKIIYLTLLNFLITFIIVLAATLIASKNLFLSIYLSIVAITISPAATLLVIKEYHSKGTLTEIILIQVALCNLLAIILFNFTNCIVYTHQINAFLYKIGLSFGIGLLGGILYSYIERKEKSAIDLKILIFGMVLAIVSLSAIYQTSPLITAIILGIIVANTSKFPSKVFDGVTELSTPFFIIFFVLAGAHIEFIKLKTLGLIGIVYIISRIIGKITGAYISTVVLKYPDEIKNNLGIALLSQAGVSISIAEILKNSYPELGINFYNIIISSIIIFEIFGPLGVKNSIVNAGEVKLIDLLGHPLRTKLESDFVSVIGDLLRNFGIRFKKKEIKNINALSLMRKNINAIKSTANFKNILNKVEFSNYDHFPVVNDKNEFIGMITFQDIRDILYDEDLTKIVIAKDLVNPVEIAAHPNDDIKTMLSKFKKFDKTYLPVVEKDNPKILHGILEQRDLLTAIHK